MKLVLLIALALILVSCTGDSSFSGSMRSSHPVIRYIDEEAGVACWIYSNQGESGIDCLPIGETLLDDGR